MVWGILHYGIYLYKKALDSFRLQYFIILIFCQVYWVFKYGSELRVGEKKPNLFNYIGYCNRETQKIIFLRANTFIEHCLANSKGLTC